MKNFSLKFFNIYGVSKELPKNMNCFKEFKTEEIFYINNNKYKIYDLLSANIKVSNIDIEPFETIKNISDDNRLFTGCKALVIGDILSNIEYSCRNYSRSIHNMNLKTEFSTYITLPENFNVNEDIVTNIYIEDINIRFLDKHHLQQSILMLVDIENN